MAAALRRLAQSVLHAPSCVAAQLLPCQAPRACHERDVRIWVHGGSLGQGRSFASAAGAEGPYKVLEVDRNASPEEIKKAYRKQALKWHPDKNPECREEAEERFGAVADAYETLSNPEKKRQFDMGSAAPGGSPGGFPGGSPGGFPGDSFHSQADAERMFRDVFGVRMEDLFGSMFGGAASTALHVGMEVRVLPDAGRVLGACRQSGIDSAHDSLRMRSLGKQGRIIKVDLGDQSVKVTVKGAGDVWLGEGAVRTLEGAGASEFSSAFGDFGNLGGNFGASNVVQRQEVVTLPDGRRVLRSTRQQRMPDGSLREETTEMPYN